MRFALIIIAAALLMSCAIAATAQYSDRGPIGLESMQRFDLLPYLWNGVTAAQASSYDRTDDNTDRSNYVYADNNEQTFLDVRGPGFIYRIWITSLDKTHEIRFYFDNDTVPRFKATIDSLFSGTLNQFPAPLAGYSSGGYFIYVPMPFRERCRIAMKTNNNVWFYYNVQYARYASADGITTWTGNENTSAVINLWNSPGNPNAVPEVDVVQGSSQIAQDATQVLAEITGPAQIKEIAIRIPQIVPNNSISDRILETVKIRAYWDGEEKPSVEAPIGEFFGCGIGEYTVDSLPTKMSTAADGYYRCFFPMPFASAAKIELVNNGPTALSQVEWIVRIGSMPDADQLIAQGKVGRFHAVYHSESPTSTDNDYTILQTAGRGCFVGCVMSLRGLTDSKEYLEGDERIHIDGSATPVIYGTGTEDFFNGGWYFKNGPFTCQSHGNPAQETDSTARNACYRYFLSDKIPYYGSIRVRLEHGNINDVNGNYSSVAFYYELGESGIVMTDELDIGNDESERAHFYTCTGQTWEGTASRRYEGDDPTLIADYGRSFKGECHFTASIDPANTGVKLRRRMDYTTPHQRAEVYVNNNFAGYWYDAGSAARWRDSDFEIPASLTAGKNSIKIRIVSSEWNEFRYRVFSYVNGDTQAPDRVTNFMAIGMDGGVYLRWTNPSQPDFAGVMIRCKADGAPTSPTDGELVCEVPGWADEHGYFIHQGLESGVTYHYAAFAYDGKPNYSAPATASAAPQALTCGGARMFLDGCPVQLENKTVTGVFPDDVCIYVSEYDGRFGIRVATSQTDFSVGDVVNVSGQMATRAISGYASERQIAAASVTKLFSDSLPKPIAVTCWGVGGSAVGSFLPGVRGGIGLNNIGSLVTIAGRVTYKAGSYIYIDDGSHVPNQYGSSLPVTGVMVRCVSAPSVAVGDTVTATGVIVGSILINWSENRAFMRARFISDVKKID